MFSSFSSTNTHDERQTRSIAITVALGVLLFWIPSVSCFTASPLPVSSRISPHQKTSSSSSGLRVIPKLLQAWVESNKHNAPASSSSHHHSVLSHAAPFGVTGVTSGSALATAFRDAPGDANVEAQVLTDVSHLSLDLVAFMGPSMLPLRVAALFGRLCSMAADYLPDHRILPEEIVFQVFMLGVACVGISKAALLPIAAASASTTVKDGKAFSALFAPAGTSWAHYKAMSVYALDWITVDAGETVSTDEDSDEYIYWLYSGTVQVENEGNLVAEVTRKSGGCSRKEAGRGLFGESRLLRWLKSGKLNEADGDLSRTTVRATTNSTLLRIHMNRLKMLTDNDQQLADSVRTLLFQGMEAKLNAQLRLKTSNATVS